MDDRDQFIKYRNQINYCFIFCIIESSTDATRLLTLTCRGPLQSAVPPVQHKNPKDRTENSKPFKLVPHILTQMYAVSRHRHTWHVTFVLKRTDKEVRQYRCVLRSGCCLASGDSTQQNAFRHPACLIGTFTSVHSSIYWYKWLSDEL